VRYLLDSDTAIDWLNGTRYAGPLLRALSAEGTERLGISLATYGELLAGIPYSRDPRAAERSVRQFLRLVDVLPITRAVMQRFARLKADLAHRGQLIGDFDTLIAATALHHRLTLVTRNVRHFGRIAEPSLHH
jgi:predicted nucleic acid-binding protein